VFTDVESGLFDPSGEAPGTRRGGGRPAGTHMTSCSLGMRGRRVVVQNTTVTVVVCRVRVSPRVCVDCCGQLRGEIQLPVCGGCATGESELRESGLLGTVLNRCGTA